MTESELKKFKDNRLIKELDNYSLPDNMDYVLALNTFVKEQKVISDEETRIFNEKIAEERLQLEKDKIYHSQKMEIDKLNEDKKKNENDYEYNLKKLKLEKKKNDSLISIETLKLEIEKMKLEIEKENLKLNISKEKEETKFKYVSLGITTFVSFMGIIIPLIVYKKLAYANLKLIYRDEGRSTVEFKDAVKCIKNMTK